MRGQKGGSWKTTGCSSPLGAYVDNTRGGGPANAAVTGTLAYAGKQALSGGDEIWTALTTMILPVGGAPFVVPPRAPDDYDAATPVIQDLVDKGTRFVAVSGLGLLAPGDTGQMNDGGPSAARTAIAYARDRDEMYVFQGGSYTPDQIQDLFRGLGSDTAILLDGGGSSAIVLRRDTGGMWAGAGVPKGSCDTMAGAVRLPRARPAELARLQLISGSRRSCGAGSRSRTSPSRRDGRARRSGAAAGRRWRRRSLRPRWAAQVKRGRNRSAQGKSSNTPSAIPSGGTMPRVRSACMMPIVIRLLPENSAVGGSSRSNRTWVARSASFSSEWPGSINAGSWGRPAASSAARYPAMRSSVVELPA